MLVVTVGGGAVPAADFVEDTGTVVPLPPTLVADPLGMPIVPPSGLGRWLETAPGRLDGVAIPAIETVAVHQMAPPKTPDQAPAPHRGRAPRREAFGRHVGHAAADG